MTEHIKKQLQILKAGEYKKNRTDYVNDITEQVKGLDIRWQSVARFRAMLAGERFYLLDNDRMGFHRTQSKLPVIKSKCEGVVPGNMTPDYGYVMEQGMDSLLEELKKKKADAEGDRADYYGSAVQTVEEALTFADRYRDYVKEHGEPKLFEALCHVPHKKPENFYEACVFMKFIIFTLRCNDNIHLTIGRFDQYMYPYFKKDRDSGMNSEALLEILEEFLISLNIDSDLYSIEQQGDNGQSMVLGGYDLEGNECYNELSELCLKGSWELCLIDPKINLRVSKKTPLERYMKGTRLTKQGLGFPQYCNDDVVIPGLIKLGYAPADAADYVVAACWEFIVPGKGADVPNIGVMNFPKAVEAALKANLKRAGSFEEVVEAVKEELIRECDSIVEKNNHFMHIPSPYFSVFFPSCVEDGKDISEGGAVYNNYGIHGTGISTAADSLMAVKRAVYDEKRCTAEELLKALECDYEGCNQLRNYLLSCPKMGNNEPEVDDIGSMLMDTFAKHMNHRKNNQGGIYRAGTGSAMEYILSAKTVGATPDGRHAGDVYGSSFSPAVTTKLEGPLSCIRSFTKYEMENIINGGPLTIEIHDITFRNEQGVQKVAMLVQTFIGLGGHQIQLNAVNQERLLDAQQHPENHRNLIVRVWGWSGYFNELDKEYQDHIIRRTEFQL